MPEGLIVKALSGYYYVLPQPAEAQAGAAAEAIQCRARGLFKKQRISPLVGDRVSYELTDNGEGTVVAIEPRKTELIRPPIANVDTAVLVFSVAEPALSLQLLDKFLVHTEQAGLETIIVLTKADLAGPPEEEAAEAAARLYRSIGYPVVTTSARKGEGVGQVKEMLAGRIAVFSGQSGVGKSSLLNAIMPGLALSTNAISHKLGRGKHTTRHVELIAQPGGGWIADTPGFSQLDFQQLEAGDLGGCFKEMRELAPGCRFRGCQHEREPGCKVIGAVEDGQVARTRYEHYLQFLTEIKDRKRRY